MINKQKYKELFETELRKTHANTVWQDKRGNYHLFGNYVVRSTKDKFVVWKDNTELKAFDRLLSAASWCVADKTQRHDVAVEIKRLDCLLSTLVNDIKVRVALSAKCTDQDILQNIEHKIYQKNKRKQEVEDALKNLFEMTKNWQSRGFTNELKRSGSSFAC